MKRWPERLPKKRRATTGEAVSGGSVVGFLDRFEALAAKEDFGLIRDLVHEHLSRLAEA